MSLREQSSLPYPPTNEFEGISSRLTAMRRDHFNRPGFSIDAYVAALVSSLPPSDAATLLDDAEHFFYDDAEHWKAAIAYDVFSSNDGILPRYGIRTARLPEDVAPQDALGIIAHHPLISRMLGIMWETVVVNEDDSDIRNYPFVLGTFLSNIKPDEMGNQLAERVQSLPRVGHTATVLNNSMLLCDNAERYMNSAIHANFQSAIYDGNSMLIKGRKSGSEVGMTAGVCIYPAVSDSTVLMPGNWYRPHLKQARHEIREHIAAGKTVHNIPDCSMDLMRQITPENAVKGMGHFDFINLLRAYAESAITER